MTKTILITGATDSIGLLTAQRLAAQGHTLLLHGRSESRLARAAEDVGGNTTYSACARLLRDFRHPSLTYRVTPPTDARHQALQAVCTVFRRSRK